MLRCCPEQLAKKYSKRVLSRLKSSSKKLALHFLRWMLTSFGYNMRICLLNLKLCLRILQFDYLTRPAYYQQISERAQSCRTARRTGANMSIPRSHACHVRQPPLQVSRVILLSQSHSQTTMKGDVISSIWFA